MSHGAPTLPVNFRKEVERIPTSSHGIFGIYRCPARFIPQAVAYLLERYGEGARSVLDPFAGMGTTGLVARLYGLDYELWDLSPLLEVVHGAATLDPPAVSPARLVAEVRRSPHRWRPGWSRLDYWHPPEALPFLEEAWGYFHSLEDPRLRLLLALPLLRATRLFSYNDPQRQKLSRSPRSMERALRLAREEGREGFYRILQGEVERLLARLRGYRSPLFDPPLEGKALGGVDSLEMARSLPEGAGWDLLITSPLTFRPRSTSASPSWTSCGWAIRRRKFGSLPASSFPTGRWSPSRSYPKPTRPPVPG